MGDSRALAKAHLTLPSLRDGPLPLRPKGRRGAIRDDLPDQFQNSGEIVDYVVIPKPDDPISPALEVGGAACISHLLLGMVAAIEFDGEFCCRTREVHDVTPDGMLSAESDFRPSFPQSPPEDCLNVGRAAAQLAG